MRERYIWVAIVLVVAGTSCSSSHEGARLLWLPPGAATDRGAQDHKDGSGDLRFTLANAQTEAFSEQLSGYYASHGWHSRLPRLNMYPSSSFTGWQSSTGGGIIPTDADGHPLPPHESLNWHGEWTDEHGDVIAYHLTATRPVGAASYVINGYGTYAPRSLVDLVERRERP